MGRGSSTRKRKEKSNMEKRSGPTKGRQKSCAEPPARKNRKASDDTAGDTRNHRTNYIHRRKDLLVDIQSMIPGPGKVALNSILIAAADHIRKVERDIADAANQLEYLEKLQINEEVSPISNATAESSLKTEREVRDGVAELRDIVPQAGNLKGIRLYALTWEYMKDLRDEYDELKRKLGDTGKGLHLGDRTRSTSEQ